MLKPSKRGRIVTLGLWVCGMIAAGLLICVGAFAHERLAAAILWLYETRGVGWVATSLGWAADNPVGAAFIGTCLLIGGLYVVTFAHDRILATRLAKSLEQVDAKRAQVEPELVYEGSPNHQTATVYCRNIGKSYAREVSIQITGNTLSPLTFEIIQLLAPAPDGAPVPVRPLFVDGYEPTILGTLGDLALAQLQAAGADIDDSGHWIRGQPPPFHPDIVLILNYVDTRTESAISDVFVFESIFPANNVMADIRWILRPRPAPPA